MRKLWERRYSHANADTYRGKPTRRRVARGNTERTVSPNRHLGLWIQRRRNSGHDMKQTNPTEKAPSASKRLPLSGAAIAEQALQHVKDGLQRAARELEAAHERIEKGPRRTSGRIS